MHILNFLELRAAVRSGKLELDINQNLFNHPYYSLKSVVELDNSVKELIFNNKFRKISDASFNPAFTEELTETTELTAQVVTNPSSKYLDTRNVSSFQLLLHRVLNYFRHQDRIKIKANESVAIPLSLVLKDAALIPDIKLHLKGEKFKNVCCTGSVTTASGSDSPTYVILFNSGNKVVYIDDLEVIGTLELLI